VVLDGTRRQSSFPLWVAFAVLAGECLLVAQLPHPWLRVQQPMAAPIVFAVTLLFFGRRRLALLPSVGSVSFGFLAVHLSALCSVAASGALLMRMQAGTLFARASIAVWVLALVVASASLVLAFVPLRSLSVAAKGLGMVWVYAAAMAAVAMSARTVARLAWDAPQSGLGHAMQVAAFYGVRAVLGVFYSPVLTDPRRAIIGTTKFQVMIAGTCSGMEGLALMLVVAGGWLVFARRELRLQRAVWLVPVALGLIWILNLLRIAALIALGDAGHGDLALNGFHSEAGWIFFNVVAIGFLVAAQKIEWLRKEPVQAAATSEVSEQRMAEAYLVPLLVVTAVSLVTRALSSGFEVLYPLRLLVGIVALWWFRGVYRKVDWRFGWLGVVAGVAVFAVWVGLARWTNPSAAAVFAGDNLAAGLDVLRPWQRGVWLAARVLAAGVVVPVVEELAFRGYVARRVVSGDVATVPYARLGVVAIVVSAVPFGLMGGRMFVGGIVAGVVFAFMAKLRNRLGEAVVAHAVASLLLAAWVVSRGEYWMW